MPPPSEKPATDIYTFENLRRDGCTYIDKTGMMLPLIDRSIGRQFFIARPRRFGKSLLVSTLQAIFEGKRELFEGLAIEDRWNWKEKYPTLRIDLGSCQAPTVEALWGNLETTLMSEAKRNKIELPQAPRLSGRFRLLVEALAAKCRVKENGKPIHEMVLLIDEYDKPLLGHLGEKNIKEFQAALKEFYSVIKTTESMQRFTLITGVSKFSKVSIFSDLNNLKDRTMSLPEAALLGYTHEEVLKYYPKLIHRLAEKFQVTDAQAFERILRMYDGYRFHADGPCLINPVSLGNCLEQGEFREYWFETGTPTFLMELMEKHPIDVSGIELNEREFSVYEPATPALMPLLYQTGYLTIKGTIVEETGAIRYHLDFPNLEVRNAFSYHLSRTFSHLEEDDHPSLYNQLVNSLRADDITDALDCISSFFANIPANITLRHEKYYQTLFFAVFTMLGQRMHAEVWTNRGRIDAVTETKSSVFIFEFKLHDTAAAALKQIRDKGYYEKYRRQGKKLFLIGAAFDGTERNLADRRILVLDERGGRLQSISRKPKSTTSRHNAGR